MIQRVREDQPPATLRPSAGATGAGSSGGGAGASGGGAAAASAAGVGVGVGVGAGVGVGVGIGDGGGGDGGDTGGGHAMQTDANADANADVNANTDADAGGDGGSEAPERPKYTAEQQQLLNWHLANIEYSTSASVDELSLRHWDQVGRYSCWKIKSQLFISVHLYRDL